MKKIRGYTLSYCPWCRKTKKFFADHGLPCEFVDYDLAEPKEQARIDKEMSKAGGGIAFPFVVIDDVAVVGYNPARWRELLNLKD